MGTAIGWLGLQWPIDHLCHLVVLVGVRPAKVKFVVQALQTEHPVALAPLANRHARQAHELGDGRIGFTGTAGQDDLSTPDDRVRQGPGMGMGLQLIDLVVAENKRRYWTPKRPKKPQVTPPQCLAVVC